MSRAKYWLDRDDRNRRIDSIAGTICLWFTWAATAAVWGFISILVAQWATFYP